MSKNLLFVLILALSPFVQGEEVPFERVFDTLNENHPDFLKELDHIINGDMMRKIQFWKIPHTVSALTVAGFVASEIIYFEATEKNHKCAIEVKFKKAGRPDISLYYDAASTEMKRRCE